jgi:hypothetical protein
MFMLLPASPFSSPSFHKQRNPPLLLDELSNLPEVLFGFQRGKYDTRGFNAVIRAYQPFARPAITISAQRLYRFDLQPSMEILARAFSVNAFSSAGTDQRKSWCSDDGVNDEADVGCCGLKKMLEGD